MKKLPRLTNGRGRVNKAPVKYRLFTAGTVKRSYGAFTSKSSLDRNLKFLKESNFPLPLLLVTEGGTSQWVHRPKEFPV